MAQPPPNPFVYLRQQNQPSSKISVQPTQRRGVKIVCCTIWLRHGEHCWCQSISTSLIHHPTKRSPTDWPICWQLTGGHFLSLERSFGINGFSVKLFQLAMSNATDTSK